MADDQTGRELPGNKMGAKRTESLICGHPERKHCAHGLCGSCYSKKDGRSAAKNKRWRQNNPEKYAEWLKKDNARRRLNPRPRSIAKHHELQRNFGIGLEQYQALLQIQNNVCAICGQAETTQRLGKIMSLAVDHDHATGRIRGLLCNNCNRMLGLGGDDVATLQAAIRYLQRN